MKKNLRLLIILTIITAVSCRKSLHGVPGVPSPEVPVKESWIALINRQVASILEEVYQNDSAYKEVNDAIVCGYYADERVMLRDLLFPSTSDLYRSGNNQSSGAMARVFPRVFNEVLARGRYDALRDALAREGDVKVVAKTAVASDLMIAAVQQEPILSGPTAVVIYFPYSENFQSGVDNAGIAGKLTKATIVAADRDADSGPGRAPYQCTAGVNSTCYKNVIVNDDYAEIYPTHIVENGARPKLISDNVPALVSGQTSRVYLGWARLTRQLDALISFTGNGGGSEIKIARLSGYLKKEGEQVTTVAGDVVTLDLSRKDIRKQRWKRIFSVWDPNWSKDNTEQVFAVYEDDTKGTKTLSGSLSTTVTAPGSPSPGKAEGQIAYKIEVSSQDEIVTQRKFDRASFFRDGLNDQGWKFVGDANDFLPLNKDWPIYDGGTIWQFSMPWRVY